MTTRPHLSLVAGVALAHAALAWTLVQSAPLRVSAEAAPTMTWVRVLMPPALVAMEPQTELPPVVQPAPRKPATAAMPHRRAKTTTAAPSIVESTHDAPAREAAAPASEPSPPAQLALAAPSSPPPSVSAPRLQPAEHAHCPRAPHPPVLRERGIEGRVVLRVRVDAHGRAGDAQVVDGGSGWRLFDAAALSSALACRFVPARRDGQPVDSVVEFSVRFALRE
jgi:protein TonB